MTGFRVARGGAAERYGVTPDLVTLGKIVGGGLPLAAFGGRATLMRQVAPAGPVYQAGTFAAHPLAMAAGLATLDAIDAHARTSTTTLEARGARLQQGSSSAAARGRRAGLGPARRVDVDAVLLGDAGHARGTTPRRWTATRYAAFFRAMLARGVLLPPSPFESAFLSMAHDDAVIDETIAAAAAAFAEARA